MTNEDLATLIRGGKRERLPELWEQVEKFAAHQARRRFLLSAGFGGVEFEDLYNSGYIALAAAVDTYDPDRGKSFISWFALALETAFAEAGGYRSRKQARDPLHHAGSLDAPLGDDENNGMLGESIEDADSAEAFQNAEKLIWNEQLHAAIEKALGELPERHSSTLRRRFYQEQTLDEIADAENVTKEAVRQWQLKGLQELRRRRDLRQFVEERTPYYLRVGVSEFHRTGESAVERIVFKRERLIEGRSERPKLDRELLEKQAAGFGEEYINSIEDSFIRISLRLRFLHGLSWKDVAASVGGGKTGSAVRDICLRYVSVHPKLSSKANGTMPDVE